MKIQLVAVASLLAIGCGEKDVPTAPSGVTVRQTMGRWAPVLGGSEGTSGQVYASQHGEWVKTGVQVFVSATVTLVKKGEIRGALEVQGLPFASDAGHDSACYFGDFDDAGADQVWVAGIIGSSSSVVMLRQRDSASRAMSPMDGDDVADNTAFEMSCNYISSDESPLR